VPWAGAPNSSPAAHASAAANAAVAGSRRPLRAASPAHPTAPQTSTPPAAESSTIPRNPAEYRALRPAESTSGRDVHRERRTICTPHSATRRRPRAHALADPVGHTDHAHVTLDAEQVV
jgi:hypothetical protein